MQAVILDPDYRDVILKMEKSVHFPSLELYNSDENRWTSCWIKLLGRYYLYRTLFSPEEGYLRELLTEDGTRVWAIVYPDLGSLHPCYAPTMKSSPFLPELSMEDRLEYYQWSLENAVINNISGYMGHGWCVFQLEAGVRVDPIYLRCNYGARVYYIITLKQTEDPNKTEWYSRRCQWESRLPIRRAGSLCVWQA